MVRTSGTWLVWITRRILLGAYGRGTNMSTPVESLNLQAGEFVEVKPMEKITETLNKAAHNRGLFFSPDMRLLCGQRQRVEKKIEKIIVDGTSCATASAASAGSPSAACSIPRPRHAR